jgi:hypothetical protein
MKVIVHIERLVFESAPAGRLNADELAESIRVGLGDRIAAHGLPSLLRSSSMQPAAPGEPSRPAPTEAGVGGALYGSLDR